MSYYGDIQLFVCDKCGCVDSTLCSPPQGDGYICTECRNGPGSWHYIFSKEQYDPRVHKQVLNRDTIRDEDGGYPSFS